MSTIFAAMRDRLLVVTGRPGGWRVRTRLSEHDLECVAAPGDEPDRVLVGTFDDGLYRSTDGGMTFNRVGDWMPKSVTALAVSTTDSDVWWAGTEPSRVFRSTDGGRSWMERPGLGDLDSAEEWSFPPRPHTHHVRWIEPDATEVGRLYVGIEAGALVRTDDGGETWQDRPEDGRRDNHSLATHPDRPTAVWAAAGDGYAESEDGGDTWQFPQTGLDHRYCWSVAVDPGDSDTVVMSAASGARSAHSMPGESYVYRRDGDGPWVRIDDDELPTGDGVLRAVLATDGPGEFYAVTNRGLFMSLDGGESWSALDVDWPEALTEMTPRGLAVV
ncbi:MAG: photosystem II stability/assembly factor-like uncharacterized protein [Halobacteriales archaeon]|jgi:photosystem II stability/assembly factor-like uncharacterized protein